MNLLSRNNSSKINYLSNTCRNSVYKSKFTSLNSLPLEFSSKSVLPSNYLNSINSVRSSSNTNIRYFNSTSPFPSYTSDIEKQYRELTNKHSTVETLSETEFDTLREVADSDENLDLDSDPEILEKKLGVFHSSSYDEALRALDLSPTYNSKMVLTFRPHSAAADTFIIIGDTKPHKEMIKQLGGKWNNDAKGWVFNNTEKKNVKKEMSKITQVQEVEADEGDDNEEGGDANGPATKKQKTSMSETNGNAASSTTGIDGSTKSTTGNGESGHGGSDATDDSSKFIDLDGRGKRVRYSNFKGYKGVDIREYYSAPDGEMRPGSKVRKQHYSTVDGEMKPGSKGICLSLPAWNNLVESIPSLNEAIGDRNESFKVEIDAKKKVNLTLSSFKGKYYVGIREYWTDPEGQEKPGKKGVSLTMEAYQKLAEVTEQIGGWYD